MIKRKDVDALTTKEKQSYDGSSIQILEGLEAVRVRPGMYIGSTNSKGLHHCVWEIVDNCIDEHLAGHCTIIKVIIHKNGSVTVEDNGRGIPVDVHPKAKIPTARVVFTVLHAGGKFGGGGYKISGGLHGVGASVVNALSEYVDVEICRDGNIYHDRYENGGKPVIGLTEKGELPVVGNAEHTGTKVTFKPDPTIFETVEFKFDVITKRLQESAYLNKGLTLVVIDERTGESVTLCEEKGIEGFIHKLNQDKETIGPIISFSGVSNEIEMDVSFQYTTEFSEQIIGYCNNIATIEGGTHVTGFKTGLTRLINAYVKELNLYKDTLDGRDIRSGLVAVISIKHPDPQYEGQTKSKLGSSDAKNAIEDIVNRDGAHYFDIHVEDVKMIVENAVKSIKIRKAEDRAKLNLQSKEIRLQTNGKLASCLSRNAKEKEIYIVEGDSAGGTAKTGRNRQFQAILPLRGKVLNIEKATIDKVMKNMEITTLFSALGCGFGDNFDINKLEYDKIVILTDADVDGSHIRTLLLTLFYRFTPELIHTGHIYRGIPPLYKINLEKKKGQPDYVYAYSDAEKNEQLKKYGSRVKGIQRFKGLGEMSTDQLWDTTLNPETRRLGRITIDNAVDADVTTTLLMGSKVEPRRDFITREAKNANIDM